MTKETCIAVNLASAPQHIRDEIKALGSEIHSKEFNALTPDTRAWLKKAAESDDSRRISMIKKKYTSLAHELGIAVIGLDELNRIIPEEAADEINLKLYNACATFCREYNIKETS